ncbi:ferric reductase-like transmembrane domain-containing protein [Aeromicrobium sp.]|nr:ferric reductase-like transmembrane domain-containing protein [Candidatus Saccharibacteria bacterium]
MRSFKKLVSNSRFYVLALSLLASLFVLAYFRVKFPSDQLYYIRTEQLFGLIAVILLYLAILITPLSKLMPKAVVSKQLLFARRGIGVAAAYFATLHVLISIQGQLGGLNGALLLPTRYKVSFGLGAVALVVLLSMAATSFDKAMQFMTFSRWKRLHRLVYPAMVLILIHIWLIGTHIEYATIRYTTYAALTLLILLESLRITANVRKKRQLERRVYIAITLGLCSVGVVSLLCLPVLAQDYHSEHSMEETTADHGVMKSMVMQP